ncbi:MAG TPA: hypothetical protein VFG04_04060 [Planctomycetaceae bacterium]|nr:hypothetical protein [Planctomycetaceae bacterium]
MKQLDLEAITLDQAVAPGTTWVENVHRCVNDADVVLGVMDDRRKNANVFFELGVASALNKPTLLFTAPDYPMDLLPHSGFLYLRVDLRNKESVLFALRQVLSLSPPNRIVKPEEHLGTRPIGQIADQFLAKLPQVSARDFEELIYDVLKASGAAAIGRGSEGKDNGVDFAVWSSDFDPAIANPLLIECKSILRNQSDVNESIGRMFSALESIHDGCGLVLFKEAEVRRAVPRSLPIFFISAEEFLKGLRDSGLAEYVLKLRNAAVHGF